MGNSETNTPIISLSTFKSITDFSYHLKLFFILYCLELIQNMRKYIKLIDIEQQ